MNEPELRIEPARREHVPLLLRFIHELAEAQAFRGEMTVDAAGLETCLFGDRPVAEALLGWRGAEPVAYAIHYPTFSSSRGRPGLHLEDLYVTPAARGTGIGTALLRHLAGVAVARGCARFEWWALKWNEPAIEFYERLGARKLDELCVFRLDGEALGLRAGR